MNIYLVECVDSRGWSALFTAGKRYKVSSEGVIDDTGYIYKDFLDENEDKSIVIRWIMWAKDTDFIDFKQVSIPIRRF
jgi:hypothetical protein